MLFFRTISLVAALAFATLTSAVPVEGAGLVSGEVFARDAAELSLPVKRGGGSIYDLYNTCHGNVVNIIVEINVAVKVGDHVKVLSCLNEIVAEIELVIDGVNAGVELDVSVDVFANLVCGLIQIIAQVAILVISINVQIRACIGTIGGLLGTLLHLTLGVVVNLDVVLVVLLRPLGGILSTVGYLGIFLNIGLLL